MKTNNSATYYTLISEYVFTLLPVVILIIVRCYDEDFVGLINNTEWSIISLILFGQCIVKFSTGVAHSKESFCWQLVGLIISLIIVIGLIPSTIILVLILNGKEFTCGIYIAQIIFFLLSTVAFFFIGVIGQELLDE